MNVFAFMRPFGIEEKLGSILMGDSPESLRAASLALEKAWDDIKVWVAHIPSTTILGWGMDLGILIPIDRVTQLKDFLHKFHPDFDLCVGIGMTPSEAYKAMAVA